MFCSYDHFMQKGHTYTRYRSKGRRYATYEQTI